MKRTPLLAPPQHESHTITIREVLITADLHAKPRQGIPQGPNGGIIMKLDRSNVAIKSLGDGGVMRYAPRMHNWDDGYIANLVLEHLEDLLGRNAENARAGIIRWVRSLLTRLERDSNA